MTDRKGLGFDKVSDATSFGIRRDKNIAFQLVPLLLLRSHGLAISPLPYLSDLVVFDENEGRDFSSKPRIASRNIARKLSVERAPWQ